MRASGPVFDTRAPLASSGDVLSQESQSQGESDIEDNIDDPGSDTRSPLPPSAGSPAPGTSGVNTPASREQSRVRVRATPRTTSPNRNSNALDREVIATLSALRSWMKKDDIKTTPQETCGHAYGTVLGTFLAKLPLDKQYGAFNELMAVAQRHIAEGMAASSVGQHPLIHQDASRPLNVSEESPIMQSPERQPSPIDYNVESPIMQSPERQPSPIDYNVEHLDTGDHGTSAFHVPNLHYYLPSSPPIYTRL